MASLRILISAVSTDVISTRNIRLIDRPSVVNLWASCVTIGDEIRAAALGLVNVGDDQLIYNLFVGPDAGDLAIPVPSLNTSLIFILSVEPA